MQLNSTQSLSATSSKAIASQAAQRVLIAALSLPGTAMADSPPEHGTVGFKYLSYQDSQPGLKRISVAAPSVYAIVPIAGKWSISGSIVADSVSGASPRWHTATSSASRMRDYRKAFDIRVTRYYDRSSFSVATAFSTEHDYVSRALSLGGTVSTEDNNRTFSYGIGFANDSINPVNGIVVGAKKRTTDLLVGVTQVLTPVDIAQLNLTYAQGHGYYNDPYKFPDSRPGERKQIALMARWNHHFTQNGATLRLSYRRYSDSFKVNAHTISAEWDQPIRNNWTITPSIRIHSQSAASFYYDPVYDKTLGEPLPPGFTGTGFYSADQRLAAYGAWTIGAKVSKALEGGWAVDMRADFYAQKASYRLFGTGSPGLAPFNARFIQLGVSKKLE